MLCNQIVISKTSSFLQRVSIIRCCTHLGTRGLESSTTYVIFDVMRTVYFWFFSNIFWLFVTHFVKNLIFIVSRAKKRQFDLPKPTCSFIAQRGFVSRMLTWTQNSGLLIRGGYKIMYVYNFCHPIKQTNKQRDSSAYVDLISVDIF